MKASRRRKTPETEIAKKIRMYAKTYAADGQRERAEGMIQAADVVDELSARGHPGAAALVGSLELGPSPTDDGPSPTDDGGLRLLFSLLEKRVTVLERAQSSKISNGASLGPFRVVHADGNPHNREFKPADGEPSLSPGELRILAAADQHYGVTNDELTAMVDYRATSLRTYLGNLRAAGYITTKNGIHHATESGIMRAQGHPTILFGAKLYQWWLSRLSTGEEKILRAVGESGDGLEVSTLVGEATGLRATSVRTYLNKLSSRRLITRPAQGKVALSESLRDA